MSGSEPRVYRELLRAGNLVPFRVSSKQTDLLVLAERNLKAEATRLLLDGRYRVESYIRDNPSFATTLTPWKDDFLAPGIVHGMIRATAAAGVGPMASVAGAISEFVGEGLLRHSGQVIVENGGDLYIEVNQPVTVAVLAGDSPLSGRFGIRVAPEKTPLGLCSSSGRVGHSYSRGLAHAACVLSRSAPLADAAATALGNLVSGEEALEEAAASMAGIEGILGVVIIAGDHMAAWGDVELVEI